MSMRMTTAPESYVSVSVTGLLLSCALFSIGCTAQAVPTKGDPAKAKPVVPSGGTLLQGAGATFPSVLYERWFSQYGADHPTTVIAYDAVGSGEGVRRFIGQDVKDEDRVDFGASDAAMRDDELQKVPSGAILLPVTAGSIALAYNIPGLSTDLKLSREAYLGIFLGQINNWSDPRIARTNSGVTLPDLTISTVVRQDGSGTTFAFTKHLDAMSDAWRSRFSPATVINWPGNSMRASGNEGVAGRIKQSIGSIGYVGYEFARRAALPVALLENRAGRFVAPSGDTAYAALTDVELPENLRAYVPDPAGSDSYPIVTLTWILLYRNYPDAGKVEALRNLLHWCLTDGQRFAPELGYARLPPDIARASMTALDTIRPSKQ
jgi:phosphate transport system substrate-binding protein